MSGPKTPITGNRIHGQLVSCFPAESRFEVIRGGDTRQDMVDDPFMYMGDDEDVVTQCPLVEEMKKTFNDWNLIRGNRSISVAPDQFPMLNRAA